MKKRNCLSENLKSYQKQRGCSLTEFSEELGIPKSTLQSLLRDGNTTLDTLMRLGEALGVALDKLVYGEEPPQGQDKADALARSIAGYQELTARGQEDFRHHLNGLMEALKNGRE